MMLIFTALMGVLFLAFFLRADTGLEKRDMSFYNDRLHKMYDDYKAGNSISEIEAGYECRIILTNGVDGTLTPELNALYAGRALVLDFAPEGSVIGKVAWDEASDLIGETQHSVIKKGMIVWCAALLAGYALLALVYIKVLKPEREMERFAEEIAKGNLDIPLPIHRDNLFGNLTTSFDIMREELKSAKEREIEAEKAKKEMVHSLSHDIGTPVATIRTACEMIELLGQKNAEESAALSEAKDLNDKFRTSVLEKVSIIDRKAETISKLTDNMLHVSLAETEHINIEVREESSVLIEEYFRELKGYGHVIIENSIPECLVYMDRLRMEQVVDNIVGNSHKYAGTDIRVSFDRAEVKRDDKAIRYLRITVRDSGPGVPEEELPLIAEKYHRGSNTTGKPGAGLGMYLATYYMEKQGGGMEYRNENGFVVELLVRVV